MEIGNSFHVRALGRGRFAGRREASRARGEGMMALRRGHPGLASI